MIKISALCFIAGLILGLSLIFFGNNALAQDNKPFTGVVRDAQNLGIPSVTVSVKGTTRRIGTNSDGAFSILAKIGDVIVFESIGFVKQEFIVTDFRPRDIVLRESAAALDEVVVVAYGTQKKATVSGAIASISTKEIKQSPAANLAISLTGKLPGLSIIQRSGEPGRDLTNLYLRGRSTVNGQAPLILVDGVERELTQIDQNEVASVTILKDASSTALFGVRGANGVILVTTKRGESEVPEINLTTEYSAQDFTRMSKPVDAKNYAILRNLALRNDGLDYQYSAEQIEKFASGSDPLRYPNTNWQDLILKDYSLQSRYNLNVSGATDKGVKYFVNAGYLNQGGQFKIEKGLKYDPSTYLDRYNFRSNVDMRLNKKLTAFLNVAGYVEKANSAAGANQGGIQGGEIDSYSSSAYVFEYINDLNATILGPTSPDGIVTTMNTTPHPSYGQINRTGFVRRSQTNVTSSFGMEQSLADLTKGLSARVMVSFDTRALNNLFSYKFYPKVIPIVDPNLKDQFGLDSLRFQPYDAQMDGPLNNYSVRLYRTVSNFQGFVNYERTFGKHGIKSVFLYQQEQTVNNGDLPYNFKGFSSRLTYDFAAKYFLEFNAGYNGSEQFAKGKRFGFFPAVSGAWNISEESFMKDIKSINYLKIRGSYGIVGNDRIGGRRFLYLDDIKVISGGGISPSLGNDVNGQSIVINSLRNADLRWERAKKSNIGIDLSLFNSLNLTVDYFYEKRDDILRNRGTLPLLIGLSTSVLPPANVGVVENRGYEIDLSYRKQINSDWFLLSKLNLNYARNRQLYADEVMLPEDYAYRYRQTGFTIGQNFGYIVEKYFDNAEEIAASPVQNSGGSPVKPGDFKYKDLTNDGVVDSRDLAPIGYSSVPEYTFSAALTVNYKNAFDLSVLFQGVTNVSNFYNNRAILPGINATNFFEAQVNSWTADRAANGSEISWPRLTTSNASPSMNANTFLLKDASYLRLKNVEIGYSLSKRLVKKIGIEKLRVYANGLNLVTWDRLGNWGIDPEMSSSEFRGSAYPITRLYNLGLNIIF